MNKKTKITGAIGGVAVAVLVAVGGAILSTDTGIPEEKLPTIEVLAGCSQGEVTLDLKYIKGKAGATTPIERVCLTNEDYILAKQAIVSAFDNKSKDYDFDVNDRDVISAVLGKEAKDQGKSDVLLSGDKDLIINLLR